MGREITHPPQNIARCYESRPS